MQFWSSDLGHQPQGTIVEVTLTGNAANVMLLDASSFADYRSGRSFRYTGGHFDRSPIRLDVPSSGTWHVVVDYGERAGSGTASVRVLTPG